MGYISQPMERERNFFKAQKFRTIFSSSIYAPKSSFLMVDSIPPLLESAIAYLINAPSMDI